MRRNLAQVTWGLHGEIRLQIGTDSIPIKLLKCHHACIGIFEDRHGQVCCRCRGTRRCKICMRAVAAK